MPPIDDERVWSDFPVVEMAKLANVSIALESQEKTPAGYMRLVSGLFLRSDFTDHSVPFTDQEFERVASDFRGVISQRYLMNGDIEDLRAWLNHKLALVEFGAAGASQVVPTATTAVNPDPLTARAEEIEASLLRDRSKYKCLYILLFAF